jgi:hypothetical protein
MAHLNDFTIPLLLAALGIEGDYPALIRPNEDG